MKILVIDYQAGNIFSVCQALKKLGVNPILSSKPEELLNADRLIFPGVGEASFAMNSLRKTGLSVVIPELKQPVLGICLGMQLLCEFSEEGNTKGLGVFNTSVKKFISFNPEDKVPHMGWNSIAFLQKHPLFQGIDQETYFYYVHSYYAQVCDQTLATTEHILPFSAALGKGNFFGVQYHPEKSAETGLKLLKNFLEL